MVFVNTNYFLRFILRDNKTQYRITNNYFLKAAKEKISIFTSVIVLFEVYWVLEDYYKLTKNELISILNKIIKMKFLTLNEKEVFQNALNNYSQSNLDLEDSYNLSCYFSNNCTDFKTFNRKLLAVLKTKKAQLSR